MGWQTRGKKRCFYHSKRVDGKVVSQYIGSGPEAEMVAEALEAAREKRQIDRDRMNAAKAKLKAIEDQTELLMRPQPSLMNTEATPHSAAESRKTSTVSTPPEILGRARTLLDSYRVGDAAAEAELLALIEQYPGVMNRFGNLPGLAQAKWLSLAVGNDPVYRAATIKKMDDLRSKFPISQNPCSRFLVERILVSSLQLAYAEIRMADLAPNDQAGFEFLSRLQQRAERQHLRAIRAWECTNRQFGERIAESR